VANHLLRSYSKIHDFDESSALYLPGSIIIIGICFTSLIVYNL